MTPSDTVIDLRIALADAEADLEETAARVIRLRVQLAVAEELDATPGRRDG